MPLEIMEQHVLNKERAELPDIDIDLAPSKRPAIFKAIREERGELGLVQVATFGTEGTKSAILTACRGYRGPGAGYIQSGVGISSGEWQETYQDGIDVDQAQYMSSLIPQERGFLWPIKDVIYGNEEKRVTYAFDRGGAPRVLGDTFHHSAADYRSVLRFYR